MSSPPTKCKGLMGRIFGHKWHFSAGGYVYSQNACVRCGYIPWQS